MAQRVFLRNFQQRFYASHSVAQHVAVKKLPPAPVQVSKAANGVSVVAQESNSPLARVVCVVKAGSRYESSSQKGVAHCMRVISDLTQKEARAFGLTREIQQMGGNIKCTTTREHLIYTLEVIQDNLQQVLPYLTGMVSQPSLRPWEISDSIPRIEYELLSLASQPDRRIIELAHKAAYREKGLGRSLYAPWFQLTQFSPDLLQEYISANFTPDRIALSGIGVSQKDLLTAAGKLDIHQPKSAKDTPSKYFGGEVRESTEDLLSFSTLLAEAVGSSSKEFYAFAVLEQILGAGPQIKWSSNQTSSKLNKAVAQKTNAPFNVQAFNVAYSDSGLFGVNVVSLPENSGVVLKTVMSVLEESSRSAPAADVLNGAKKRVQASIAFQAECHEDLVEARAIELLNNNSLLDVQQAIKAVDCVTASDVQNAAKKVTCGKMTLVSLGEISSTPFLDELKA